MKWLKLNWMWVTVLVLAIGGFSYLYRAELSAFFGGFEKSSMGYQYRFAKGKKLEKVKGAGYHIVYQYAVIGPKGDTIENGTKNNVQLVRAYPEEVKNFLDEIMQMATPGAIVEILVPVDSMREHNPNDPKLATMQSGENAKFVIHILKVLNDEEFQGYQNQRLMDRLTVENKQIDDFAAKKKDVQWTLDSTKWVKYYVINKNDKPLFFEGDRVEFHYEIYKLNGELISGSLGGPRVTITIGDGKSPLMGVDFVTRYLADGESGFFLVTSDYGYGAEGYPGLVKPYTPLAIKITDIRLVKK